MTKEQPSKSAPAFVNPSYEAEEAAALFRILELGQQDIAAGRYRPAEDVFADLRRRC